MGDIRDLIWAYPSIERHALVGDRRTAALVAADGTADWLCLGDYQGLPVLGSLLDQRRGGFFRMVSDCQQCRGSGKVIKDPCPECHGAGRRSQAKTLEVSIPAGVHAGQQIRLAGQGDAGDPGGQRGDLYVVIDVADDPIFERDGNNLFCQVPISFTQAALGADIQAPTLAGREAMTIKPGTQSGEVITLSGKGLPDLRGFRQGDLLVQVIVEVPRKLSAEQKDLLRRYAESEGKSVLPQREKFLERLRKYFANGGTK